MKANIVYFQATDFVVDVIDVVNGVEYIVKKVADEDAKVDNADVFGLNIR